MDGVKVVTKDARETFYLCSPVKTQKGRAMSEKRPSVDIKSADALILGISRI